MSANNMDCKPEDFVPAEGLLDNTQITEGSYIAHIAVPCRDLAEAARWYSGILGAQPVRILNDRVTFSVGGVLQLVCHLERRALDPSPRAYPRHFGLTFLKMADFEKLSDHIDKQDANVMARANTRFGGTPHEHRTLMLVDPSNNVVEFKCYLDPTLSY